MREIYNEQYYHNYHSGCGPIPYEEPEHWVKFFGTIADHIVSDLNPTVVLDAGCAMGYLVAALRDRGVEAYGVDISEYAISKVREDIKPYCTVGSLIDNLPDSLPRHYDLVITIEVLEHLNADDGKRAIANLCTLSDTILFSSTPSDFTEPTHINVQQREYWAKLFAEHGFYDDLGYRPLFVSRHAIFYQKMSLLEMVDKTAKAVSLMDERFWRQEADLVKQVDQVKTQIKKVRERDRKLLEQGAAIQKLNADLAQQIEKVRERDRKLLEQGAAIQKLNADLAQQIEKVRERDRKLLEQGAAIQKLNADLAQQIEKVRERDRKLLEQGAAIQKLNADLAQQIEKVRERD